MIDKIAPVVVFFILLITMGSYFPISIRQLSGQMFKAGEEDPNLFYERFNRKRLRRIVFALVGAVFIGILHWFDVGIIYQISAITLVILIYSSVIVWDMFHARR